MPKMMSDFQKGEIVRLTRLANRRIERAGAGQRSYLEYWVNQMTGSKKFSASTKGLTFEQAQARLHELYKFVDYAGSTKKGWEELKKISVERANEKLGRMNYDLTDEELADILEQLDSNKRKDFYLAVNKVQAAKDAAGSDWSGSADEIADAVSTQIAEKNEYQAAYELALKGRQERAARKASKR
ncbi:MAG: hypothetical protein J6W33_01985 [Spirochaetia bacterium]|nr:hypothetical protein [Spirochaetia bacterium]